MGVSTFGIVKSVGKLSLNPSHTSVYSDRFVCNVKCPGMVVVAKDDKICQIEHVPRTDIQRNPNLMLVEAEHGGHTDFFVKAHSKDEEGMIGIKRVSPAPNHPSVYNLCADHERHYCGVLRWNSRV